MLIRKNLWRPITIHKDIVNIVRDNYWYWEETWLIETFKKWEVINSNDLTTIWRLVLWWLDAFYKWLSSNN